MKNLLLGIIAINLTFISVNLTLRSIEPVDAQMNDWAKSALNDWDEDEQPEDIKNTNNNKLMEMVDDATLVSLIKNTVARNCYSNHDHDSFRHDHTIRKVGSERRYSFTSSNESVNMGKTKATIYCN